MSHLGVNTQGIFRHSEDRTSRFVGVYRCRKAQSWTAQITHLKQQIYLGSFDSEEQAARAYNEAAVRYFGATARLNDLSHLTHLTPMPKLRSDAYRKKVQIAPEPTVAMTAARYRELVESQSQFLTIHGTGQHPTHFEGKRIIILGTTMTDETPMPFGQYKGRPMGKVPADYLLFLWEGKTGPNMWDKRGGVAEYIRANFAAICSNDPDKIIEHPPEAAPEAAPEAGRRSLGQNIRPCQKCGVDTPGHDEQDRPICLNCYMKP